MVGIPQFVVKIILHFIVLCRKTHLIYVDMVLKVWESRQRAIHVGRSYSYRV